MVKVKNEEKQNGREFIVARVRVQNKLWCKLKARASLLGKPVSEYVGQILEKEAMENDEEERG